MITNIMTVMYMRDAQARDFERAKAKAAVGLAPCPTCQGAREVPRPNGNSAAPCHSCCCIFCGNVTDTPPECRDCFVAEDDMQKRRSDL